MKSNAALLIASLFLSLNVRLQSATVSDDSAYRAEPIFTDFAQTSRRITLNGTISYFRGVELQEADHFDGYTAEAEVLLPFLHRFQLRLLYPFRTDGTARLTKVDKADAQDKVGSKI